jgi:hypothetical protein
MDNIWTYFKSLFAKAEESSPSKPLIHELIERSDSEADDYQRWKNTLVCRRLMDWLDNQYAVYRILPQDVDEGLDFLDTPSSKGFVVHFHQTRYSRRDATHFFDYLKEQVLGLGYRPQISDTRTYNRASWVETVERHYLKPRTHFPVEEEMGGKIDQKFGNILIELELRNDQAYNLRFRATSYNDRLYEEAEDFQELMKEVLAPWQRDN